MLHVTVMSDESRKKAKIHNANDGKSHRSSNYQTATDGQIHFVHQYQHTRPSTHSGSVVATLIGCTFLFPACVCVSFCIYLGLCVLFLVYHTLASPWVRGHPHLIACQSVLESQLLCHVIFHYAFDSSPGSWGSV